MERNFIPRLRFRVACVSAALLFCMAGCQTVPGVSTTSAPSAAPLPPLPVPGAVHYVIDSKLSDVRFLVYKAGALASFGHDHVVQATDMQGDVYLAADFQASGFSLTLPVSGFTVDDPVLRSVEGPDFAKQPSQAAMDGTRKNMLGPALLDAEHYPEVKIRSVKLLGPDWGPDVTVRITLRGTSRDLTVPIAVERSGDTLTITGSFELKQSDFGITPFSALGGGLQVADGMRVRLRLVAQKAP